MNEPIRLLDPTSCCSLQQLNITRVAFSVLIETCILHLTLEHDLWFKLEIK